MTITLEFPDQFFAQQALSEAEIKLEIAVAFFRQDKLTLGQAAHLAGLPQFRFQQVLGARKIAIHGGEDQLLKDIERLEQ